MTDTSFKHCLEVKKKFDTEFSHLNKLTIVRPIDHEMFNIYCNLYSDNFTQEAIDNTLLLKFAGTENIYEGYNVYVFEQDELDLDNGYLAGMSIDSFVKRNNLSFEL